MRLLLSSRLITVALVLAPVVALGDAHSHRKAAENLLIVMEVDQSLPKITAQVVETQVQQNPQLVFITGQIGLRQAQAHQTELRQML
jgi:hypothetical protein